MKSDLLVKKLKSSLKKKIKFTFAILVIFMITGNIGLAVDTLVFDGGVHIVTEDIEVDEDDSVAIEVYSGGVVTSKGNITTTGTVTSGSGGEVIYGEVADGMYAENSEIINDGKITTLNRDALGMDGSNSKLTNNGTINIQNDDSWGMAAGDNSVLINNGEIITNGVTADGMYGKDSTVINEGKITTLNNDALGMDGNNSELINNGVIETNGNISYGLTAGTSQVINNNSIKTFGKEADGVFVSISDASNGGIIQTFGIGASGISVRNNSSVINENNGYIESSGERSKGIESLNALASVNNGNIKVTGTESIGLYLGSYECMYDEANVNGNQFKYLIPGPLNPTPPGEYNNNILGSSFENKGTIKSEGDNSIGAYLTSEKNFQDDFEDVALEEGWIVNNALESGSKLENSGDIISTGIDSTGIYAYSENGTSKSQIVNTGKVAISGDNSTGIKLENSALTNNGVISIDGSNSYGIVYDDLSTLNLSNSSFIRISGSNSVGIKMIPSNPSPRPSIRATAAPASFTSEDGSLVNDGAIIAKGQNSSAVVLDGQEFINNGTVSSESGYAILSNSGDNRVTLTSTSNVDGTIKGGMETDILILDGENIDDFNVEGYEKVIKTGGGTWTLENSNMELEASDNMVNISNYSEALNINNAIDGDIVIGDNSTLTIRIDENGNSGQVIASSVTVAGDVNLDIDSSANQGLRELEFENMIVTESGVKRTEEGEIKIISGGWELNNKIKEDGTVDVRLSKVSYTDRLNSQWMDLAKVLELNYDSASGDMRDVMNTLNDINNTEYNEALEQMSGNLYTSTVFVTTEISKQFEKNIRGFMNQDSVSVQSNINARGITDENKQYLGFIGSTSNYDGDESTTGFDTDSYGFIGATELSNGFGISYGYINTCVDYEDKGESSSDIETFHGGLFHKYRNKGFRFNTNLAFDYNKNEVDRKIIFGAEKRTAKSDFDSYSAAIGTELGYDIYLGNWTVTPKAGFTYARIEQDSFAESGANSLNINQDDESYDSLRSTVGMDIKRDVPTRYGMYKFYVNGEWRREYGDVYDDQSVYLGGADGKFTISGLDISDNTYRGGVGIELEKYSGTSYFLNYTYEAESSYDSHMGTVGVKLIF